MSKKRWLLLILCVLFITGYIKFFHKTYSETTVAKNADCIFALDVKRLTNTIIWNMLTTPGQWKRISFSGSGKPGWKNMVKIPDFVFVFHVSGQPANAWYSIFEIKNDNNFAEGLILNDFTKEDASPGMQYYVSRRSGIMMMRAGNKLLIGNNAIENKEYLLTVSNEMFVKKHFITREKLFKNIEASSHLSLLIQKNDFLQEDAVVKLNFDRQGIIINTLLNPQQRFTFLENNFRYAANILCSSGFTQPSQELYNLIPSETKIKISRAINFNIDSLLLPSNHYYDLGITAIAPRPDSAISYNYDDNFNQVEKVVVNNVTEPFYTFNIYGDSVSAIYNYWTENGQIEKSSSGDLFLPMPFAKSYCRTGNKDILAITSAGFREPVRNNTINCIFFFRLLMTKLSPEIISYLPADIADRISNLESIEINFKKAGNNIKMEGIIRKKNNDLPIVNW